MLSHSLGGAVIFISLQQFIFPYLTYCHACKPEVRGIAIWAVSLVRQNKVLLRNKNYFPKTKINLTCLGGKALVNKLWLLLFTRAELDLRLTNVFLVCGLGPCLFLLHAIWQSNGNRVKKSRMFLFTTIFHGSITTIRLIVRPSIIRKWKINRASSTIIWRIQSTKNEKTYFHKHSAMKWIKNLKNDWNWNIYP